MNMSLYVIFANNILCNVNAIEITTMNATIANNISFSRFDDDVTL